MKEREILRKTAIQDVAGVVSGCLTWSHFRVYAAPRFAAIGIAIEKGGLFPSRLLTNYLGHSPLHESRVAVTIIGCPAGWSKWPSSEAAASEGANRTPSRTLSL